MSDIFDLVVIGAGPGGYECAIRASQLGMTVACVEKREHLGGTCLNVGCIPSKALLHASEKVAETKHFKNMGIDTGTVSVNWKQMLAFKDEAVKSNTEGIAFLFRKNKIEWVQGTGKIAGPGKVDVTLNAGGKRQISGKHVVIATGSDTTPLPGITIDETRIVSSTGALTLEKIPERLIVIGGGAIGLELGSVYCRLGAQVQVIEFLDHILPGMDAEIRKNFQRILKKQGITFKTGSRVTQIDSKGTTLKVNLEPAKGGKTEELEADVVLVSVGRRPCTEGLGVTEAGLALNERGQIRTGPDFQTSVSGIYAIGDAVDGPMLAHKAMEEGTVLAEMLAGQKPHVNYDVIPAVVYTHPEVASVGKTEEQLKAENIPCRTGKFPFTANGRAKANQNTDGFVKIIAHAETDAVLGVHIISAHAGEMIHEAVAIMEFGGSAEDIARSCHAHPTLSEATKEAALAVHGRPIHM